MNQKEDMMQLVCSMTEKDRQSILNLPEASKEYDTNAIYDDPIPYMSVRGIFHYVGIEVIGG